MVNRKGYFNVCLLIRNRYPPHLPLLQPVLKDAINFLGYKLIVNSTVRHRISGCGSKWELKCLV
jgi:hypothetical protein